MLPRNQVQRNQMVTTGFCQFCHSEKTGEVKKKRDTNGKPYITTLYNVIFTPDFCNWLFSIIMLMNLGHTWLFHKGFHMVFFCANLQNAVKLLHSAHRKHTLLVKTTEKSKSQKKTKWFFFWIIASENITQVRKVTTGLI